MDVQRTGNDYSVDVLLIQQAAMVVVGLDLGDDGFRFSEATRVDVGHRHHIHVRHGDNLFEQLRATAAHANHANAYTVVGPEHARWIHHQCSGTHGCLLYEVAPCNRSV